MARGGGRQKKGQKNSKFSNRHLAQTDKASFGEQNMDDEIDAFLKQRDVVPIDGSDGTDEDDEQPVFDFKGLRDDSDDTDGGDSDDDAAIAKHDKDHDKMVKQQRILRKKYGGVEDEESNDSDGEDKHEASFSRGKQYLYGADNIDFEVQSDEEDLVEEEAIAVMSQAEKAKSLSMEDFGLEDADVEGNNEDNEDNRTFQDLFSVDDHKQVKKDMTALTKEEQMDIVYSSAPELVGLLSELNEAVENFNRLKPLLHKAKDTKGLIYFETKQKLLLAYIQAISFYLLLKSEGHSVRDHPVIAHLVELKNLCEKVKNVDAIISPWVDTISDSAIHAEEEEQQEQHLQEQEEDVEEDGPESESDDLPVPEFKLSGDDSRPNPKQGDQKHKDGNAGHQSLQMLKVRALLEQKMKEKGIFEQKKDGSKSGKRQIGEDDAADEENDKLGRLVPANVKARKLASGDADLPKRENIGEKRKKYDLQVLARLPDTDADTKLDLEQEESEDEFYAQVKRQRLTKLSAKAALYTRDPAIPSSVETEADGKRQITYQMEKNKGLTRNRKKLTKIPRKKYKVKHAKAVVRRKGQVRDIRKPTGSYGGEASLFHMTRPSFIVEFLRTTVMPDRM